MVSLLPLPGTAGPQDRARAALHRVVAEADHVVLITGAGVSASSGLPLYRTDGQRWDDPEPSGPTGWVLYARDDIYATGQGHLISVRDAGGVPGARTAAPSSDLTSCCSAS